VDPIVREKLQGLAAKYVWWRTPADAMTMPERVIAQVMDTGDYADVQDMADLLGDEVLRGVVRRAEAGQFSERSWAYWHYRLGMAAAERVPPEPSRNIP
jgi:hypothetical protein